MPDLENAVKTSATDHHPKFDDQSNAPSILKKHIIMPLTE